MNAVVTVSAVELALLRLEAARNEVTALFDRARLFNRDLTDEEDERLSVAEDARERAEAELLRVVKECCGVDLQRLADAIS